MNNDFVIYKYLQKRTIMRLMTDVFSSPANTHIYKKCCKCQKEQLEEKRRRKEEYNFMLENLD